MDGVNKYKDQSRCVHSEKVRHSLNISENTNVLRTQGRPGGKGREYTYEKTHFMRNKNTLPGLGHNILNYGRYWYLRSLPFLNTQ